MQLSDGANTGRPGLFPKFFIFFIDSSDHVPAQGKPLLLEPTRQPTLATLK